MYLFSLPKLQTPPLKYHEIYDYYGETIDTRRFLFVPEFGTGGAAMTLYDFIRSGYPSLFSKLSRHYPAMLDTARETEVIPWRDEWAEGRERNPEVIVQLKQLERMLKAGQITQEEYEREAERIATIYASRIEGISFIEAKQVSFRDIENEMPSEYLIVHELGHVHFRETDLFWNRAYGGGEVLVWLTLKERYRSTEEQVRLYMDYLHRVYEDHLAVAEEVVEKCWLEGFSDPVPSFYGLMLNAGTIPLNFALAEHTDRPWEASPTREDVFSFFHNLVEGLKWNDPFYVEYARRLGIVEAL